MNVIKILQTAMYTELICFLRYRRHSYMCRGIDSEPIRQEFLIHSGDEFEHANMLADRIDELGGDPDFNPTNARLGSDVDYSDGISGDLRFMIQQNKAAELLAIEIYTEAIRLIGQSDPATRLLLEQILSKENEHLNDLENLL